MIVNNSNFILPEIPRLHPLSNEYIEFYREQKLRNIEGYWSSGKWCPGNLYFYFNFCNILLNKSLHSKAKTMGKPLPWDIFWEIAYYWQEARGLTGFTGQPEVMKLKKYYEDTEANPSLINDSVELEIRKNIPNIRELLRTTNKNLGRPLYLNEAKDAMLLTNRGSGKSFFSANGIILHEFLFDGLKEYNDDVIKNPPSTEVLVGAGDSKYSDDLLKKVKLSMENLPGGMFIGNKYYPCPFYKQTSGSWQPGKEIIHLYKKKLGGTWKEMGTRSKIKHRTYGDNPFAAQGTRPAVAVKEEIGMFDNLIATQEADVETMKHGTYKFGSTMYIGTGGDMGGGTIDASKMFYAPETYNLISIPDLYENKGNISIFIPATQGKSQYKDQNGNTRLDYAKEHEDKHREKLRSGKNASTALDAYIQYNPLVPSEIFLSKNSNIFPKAELQAHLAHLETNEVYRNAEYIGNLNWGEDSKIEWRLDPSLRPIQDFPLDHKKDDIEGCVVIWEHPFIDEYGNVPHGLYLAGTDPYDHDESGTPSLGSTFIYKRYYSNDQTYETIVAEYTGRPKADTYYANLIKLLLYYNARCLYENEKKGLHQYAAQKNYDYLLMDQPQYIKDVIANSKVNRGKGMHMNESLKIHGETLIKNWLEEEYNPGQLQLTKIKSIPLIKELINYNRKEGNYDRCLTQGTLITTINGYKKVEDIKVGELVLTKEGNYKEVTWLDSHISNRDIVELKTIGSYEKLLVTDNHPILTAFTTKVKHSCRKKSLNNKFYIDAGKLDYKYQFVLHPKRKNLVKSNCEDDLLYLLGWYCSDGYINTKTNNLKITFQRNQESIADDIIEIIEKYTKGEQSVYNNRIYKAKRTQKIIKDGYIIVKKTSANLVHLFSNLCGGPNHKKLSPQLYNCSGLLPFIKGFLEGDGHQKYKLNYDGHERNAIECSSIYEDLIKQIRQILIDNSIWSSISIKKPRLGKKQFNINITGKGINTISKDSKKFKIVENLKDNLKCLEDEDGFWVPVKKIKITKSNQKVYNFEVKDSHTYIANGIVTHNCMAFMCTMYAIQERLKLSITEPTKIVEVYEQDFFNRPLFTKNTMNFGSFRM